MLTKNGIVEAAWCIWALLGLEAWLAYAAPHVSGLLEMLRVLALCGMAALQVFLLCLIVASVFRRLVKGLVR